MRLVSTLLDAFIEDVEDLIAIEPDPRRVVAGVQERLPLLLDNPDFLAPSIGSLRQIAIELICWRLRPAGSFRWSRWSGGLGR